MKKFSFSIENLLVVIAILMILTATFAPHFAKGREQTNSKVATAAHVVHPARAH